ncbi:MAG: VOC family protein [Acidimicrobiales bacterium]
MKKRPDDQQPFEDPPVYGRSLAGLQLNLLVDDMAAAVRFHLDVLQVNLRYHDPDIAIAEGYGTSWMVHSDHTYDKHPLHAVAVSGRTARGAGLEIRLHGCDPDAAAARAIAHGYTVFDGPRDQPDHGLREAHIRDAAGYMWVPDAPL